MSLKPQAIPAPPSRNSSSRACGLSQGEHLRVTNNLVKRVLELEFSIAMPRPQRQGKRIQEGREDETTTQQQESTHNIGGTHHV
jgi:hypothetical protein